MYQNNLSLQRQLHWTGSCSCYHRRKLLIKNVHKTCNCIDEIIHINHKNNLTYNYLIYFNNVFHPTRLNLIRINSNVYIQRIITHIEEIILENEAILQSNNILKLNWIDSLKFKIKLKEYQHIIRQQIGAYDEQYI